MRTGWGEAMASLQPSCAMRLIGLLIFALPWVVAPGTANPFLEMKEFFLLAGGW